MNAIDVALIAPGAMTERYCEDRSFQMALAGCLVDPKQTDYHKFYNQSWKPWNATWLLDNGAWEKESVDPETLLRIACKCSATEIMAPDVLYEPEATLEKTLAFLKVFKDYKPQSFEVRPRVAVVAHGSTMQKSLTFVESIHVLAPEVKTIAISRTTAYASGNPTARLELALAVKKRYPEYQIHLLGFNDAWPTEVQHCNSFPKLIRSVDTTMPFLYAYYGLAIDQVSIARKPKRPDDYFELTFGDFDLSLVKHNIAVLDTWAHTSMYTGKI